MKENVIDQIIYDKICIICPTRGRAKTKLPIFIKSILETAEDIDRIFLSFVVNKEDQDSMATIVELCENTICYEVIMEKTERCDLSHYYNLAFEKSNFNNPNICVGMFGDDMVFLTKNWDTMVLEKINETFGFSIVYGDDDYCQHEELCVYFVTTREFVKATGKPFMCTKFAVDFIDNIWLELGKKLNCLTYLPNLHIRHDHATKDKKPDSVWLRMRNEFEHSHKNLIIIDDYTAKMAESVREYLKGKFLNDDIAYCMTTYNRVSTFRKTVSSWNKSVLLPSKLFVFDDASEDVSKIMNEVTRMKNAFIIKGKKRLGCNKKNATVISNFDEPAIMMIDSDTAFAPHWCIAANVAWNKIKADQEIAGITLFNAKSHEMIDENGGFEGLNLKASVGGFGTIYKNETIKKALSEVDILKASIQWSWDNFVNDSVKRLGKRYCSTRKSYLQHTGFVEGTHISDGEMCDYAPDFIGKLENQWPVKSTPVSTGSNILFAAMARLGDIIAASMIANMLISRGMQLSFVVINRHVELARRICPEAKILSFEPLIGGPQGEWSEATTDQLKAKYPNYSVYINAQIGSRENHHDYTTSGKHPCVWIRDLCNRMLGIELDNEFTKYLRFMDKGIVFTDRNAKVPDKLAVISRDSITSQTFDRELPKKIFNTLKSRGYNVRFLTEKRPQRCSIKEIREECIFGLSIEQCVILLKRCSLFVGQDSGLAWCSLYSECKKQIYHRRSRVEMVNTYFNLIDKNAEDIILEG